MCTGTHPLGWSLTLCTHISGLVPMVSSAAAVAAKRVCWRWNAPISTGWSTQEASQIDPDFPIEFEVGNGEIIGSSLKQNHPHYTQIQCQLSICEKSYCDLMMFTFRGSIVTRVYREDNFIPKHLDRINAVYKSGILPELMTRQYRDVICDPCGPSSGTSSSSTSSSTPATQRAPLSTNVPQQAPTEAAQELFCYCRKPDDGSEEMVGCDYQNCVNQWYHLSCLTLSKAPKTKLWFCPECKSLQPPKKKRKWFC